jgi:hypothetical protein
MGSPSASSSGSPFPARAAAGLAAHLEPVDHRRVLVVLAHRAAEGRLEVDDVAQQDVLGQKLVAPDGDRLEGQRASQSPAIIVLRPASMRLAMAISPSRERSSTEPISRRYIRTGSSVRSSVSPPLEATAISREVETSTISPLLVLALLGLVVLDDVDAHLREHRHHVLDLLGGHLFGRQDGVQLVVGDVAALLRVADHPLDRAWLMSSMRLAVLLVLLALVVVLGGHELSWLSLVARSHPRII